MHELGKNLILQYPLVNHLLSDSTISEGDVLLVSVDDNIYYQFKVIDKTEEEIRLKKVFEIEKSIDYSY